MRRIAVENVPAANEFGAGKSRAAVQRDIDKHIAARKAYGAAVAWTIAAESQNLPKAQLEQARLDTHQLYEEMQDAARRLLICMPTDIKGLVDLLLYMEKNFSVLPQEISHTGNASQSLALDLLRTVRLSLREIAKYSKYGPTS